MTGILWRVLFAIVAVVVVNAGVPSAFTLTSWTVSAPFRHSPSLPGVPKPLQRGDSLMVKDSKPATR